MAHQSYSRSFRNGIPSCTNTSKEALQKYETSLKLYTRTGSSTAAKLQFITRNAHREHKHCLGKGQSGCKVAEELHQTSVHFFFGLWNSQLAQAVLQFPGFAPKGKFQRKKKRLFDWLQSSSKLDDTVHIKQQNSFHSNTYSLFAQLFLGHLSVTLLPANSCREGRLLAAL